MEAGTIAKWSINEGESFSAGDVIAEIQTDKATVDFEAQDDAILAKILVKNDSNEEVKVGDPICIFVDDEEDVKAFKDYVASTSSDAVAVVESVVDLPVTSANEKVTPIAAVSVPVSSVVNTDGRIIASPLAHKTAKELGIVLGSVTGTGPNGRILANDVREFVPPLNAAVVDVLTSEIPPPVSSATTTTTSGTATGNFTDYATTLTQQQLASALTAQKQNVPHYYLTVDLNLDAIQQLRKSNSNSMSMNALLLKAAVCALKDCPVMNARWMDGFVRMYHEVSLEYVLPDTSIVIPNAAAKGVTEMDAMINNDVDVTDSSVGTFSVVNLGMYGVKAAAPIIRPGQSGILGIGAAENRVVPSTNENEEYDTAVMATATLSCDHRVVDGAVGAQWLAAFKGYVENPISMIM